MNKIFNTINTSVYVNKSIEFLFLDIVAPMNPMNQLSALTYQRAVFNLSTQQADSYDNLSTQLAGSYYNLSTQQADSYDNLSSQQADSYDYVYVY